MGARWVVVEIRRAKVPEGSPCHLLTAAGPEAASEASDAEAIGSREACRP